MSNPRGKLPAGSPVTAFSITAWNKMLDMLDWWDSQQGRGGASRKIVDWDQTVFRVKNGTGGDLASYAPIGIDGPIFDPASGGEAELLNQTSMSGVAPVAGEPWGVMVEAAADGKIGRCCLVGVVPVEINVVDAGDWYADIDGDGVLSSGPVGAEIFWKASGTGTKWAIVRLGNARPCHRWYSGTLPGALAVDDASIAGCDLTAIDGGSDEANVTVYNILNTDGDGGFAGVSGEQFKAIYNQATGHFEFVDMPCKHV